MNLIRAALVVVLALDIVAVPTAADQQPKKVYRVGFSSAATRIRNPLVDGFQQGLREHGYTEGQNLSIEWRFAEGKIDLLPGFAADLVSRNLDVIVTEANAVYPVKKATTTIPIVFTLIYDPVAVGLVPSLARPGANITGFTHIGVELAAKRLELLKETIPSLKSVVIPVVRGEPQAEPNAKESQVAGHQLALDVRLVHLNDAEDIQRAFRTALQGAGAVCLPPSSFLFANRTQIMELAARSRVPVLGWHRGLVDSGAFMSYGASHFEIGRRAAEYVNRILKGAKPADLPVEQPTKFELVINLKTAKALGLTIPPSLLLRVDHIIE
jgi:putative ABC transport system substrate-binding protein